MIRPEDEYTNTTPADADYPGGSAKNTTSPGSIDGTPWELKIINDMLGTMQVMLDQGNTVFSGVPDTVLASDFFNSMVKIMQRGLLHTDTGSANTYEIDNDGGVKEITAYADTDLVVFPAGNTNTGASTLKIGSLAAKSLTLPGGTALTYGKLISGQYAVARFDAVNDRFELISASFTSSKVSIGKYGNSLTTAIAAIGSNKVTLLIDGLVTLTQPDTVLDNITLEPTRDGKFTGAQILIIEGDIVAGNWNIFDSSVTVVITQSYPRFLRWFSTFTQAKGAMIDGATLKVFGVFDVGTFGVLDSDTVFNIIGGGWSIDSGTISGTYFVNTGGDTVDSPVISFNPATRKEHVELRGFAVEHEGATSHGIEFDNVIYNHSENVYVENNDIGFGGFHYKGDSFFARNEKCKVKGFIGKGIFVEGTGSEHIFTDLHASSTNPGVIGLETNNQGTKIYDGQFGINNATASKGIYFNNVGGSNLNGGVVQGVFFENFQSSSTLIEIDGTTNRFDRIRINDIRLSLADNLGTAVKIINSSETTVTNPIATDTTGGGTLIEWGAGAIRCTAQMSPGVASVPMVVNASATTSLLEINGSVNTESELVTNIFTDSNLIVTVPWSNFFNSPMRHNGSLWHTTGDYATTQVLAGGFTWKAENGRTLFVDPDGAARNIVPQTTELNVGATLILVNIADAAETITFEPAGLNQDILQNETGVFAWDGTDFHKVSVN